MPSFFEIWNKIHSTKEKCQSLNIFLNLYGLWQELDYYQHFQTGFIEDAVEFQKLLEKERVYSLTGLNIEYDPIRVHVLSKDPFPPLEQAYTYVQQKESRNVMLYTYSAPVKKAGMIANFEPPKATSSEKDHLHCDYYGKLRRNKETC